MCVCVLGEGGGGYPTFIYLPNSPSKDWSLVKLAALNRDALLEKRLVLSSQNITLVLPCLQKPLIQDHS